MIHRTYATTERKSRFVIVAPHAAGDDMHTGDIADKIAQILNGSVVINDRFVKPTNSRALDDLSNVEDFNMLSWKDGKYSWSEKKPKMKEFYDQIMAYVDLAKQNTGQAKAVVVYIHGMKDGNDKIAVDIGYGVKFHDGRYVSARVHPDAEKNTGVRRASHADIKELRDSMQRRLNERLLGESVGIAEAERYNGNGKRISFAAWSRKNGIQYHAGSKDASFQIEIASSLRQNPEYIARIIAEGLHNAYRK
jgi:hypothetical protein